MIKKKHISVSQTVNTTERAAFEAVTNWSKQGKWIALTKVRGLGKNSRSIGGKLEAFTGIGRLGFIDTMTITKWENNKLCEVTHTGNVVKGKGVFEVSRKNSSTIFTWSEFVELPFGFFGRIGWIFVKPVAWLGMKLSLLKFKKLVESK